MGNNQQPLEGGLEHDMKVSMLFSHLKINNNATEQFVGSFSSYIYLHFKKLCIIVLNMTIVYVD